MSGKIVAEVAELMCEAAEGLIARRITTGDDPLVILRGSLMYALVACELSAGASREEILAFVNKLYDILNQPATNSLN